ncbi:hypothetical protein [Streptomyces sp. NPDC020917]|uniref:hypothetical protein n=1 Tax=Streptomyces sp. NPDC020917 TaxID=3365102 RepID=UPI0037A9443D
MQLKLGDTLLGTLVVDGGDMPWWYGHFQPTVEFTPARPLFDEWSRAVEESDEAAMIAADQALEAMDLVITGAGDGEPLTEFLLYIDDDRFRLRY